MGADTYWTFAPGVGPVQFGQGGGAFFLARHNGTALAASAPTQAPAPTAQTPSGRTWIAIDANPPPNEGYSRQAKEVRARMAREAGATFLYYAPKWSEMEPSPGTFQFGELDEKIAIAEQNDWPVALNIRTIDTHRRSMPAAYEGLAWTDARMADRLADLLRQVSAHTRGRVRWLTIGNEVNDYFKSRKGEVGGYAQLVRRVSPLARQLFPGAEISVNFTWFAMGDLGRDYKALVDASDFVSLTYYPLNADISFRAPDTVGGDVANMARFAGGKRVFLQEVGYASSSRIASEQRQADFVANLFAALRANPSVVAANFVWMSDLPDSVVDDLTRHYDLERNSNFREYLATLGYFDKNGRAKPAWEVLRREASRLR
jgi:GH35 family endo-1,4-beta-xylanase